MTTKPFLCLAIRCLVMLSTGCYVRMERSGCLKTIDTGRTPNIWHGIAKTFLVKWLPKVPLLGNKY